MKALARLPMIVLATLVVLLAFPASTHAALPSGQPAAASHDVLVLRAGDPVYGWLSAQPANGRRAHQLPRGLFDRDGRILYVATPQFTSRTVTSIVQAIDAASGRTLRSVMVPGNFSTAAGDYVPGALTSSLPDADAGQQALAGLTTQAARQHMPAGLTAQAILPKRYSSAAPIDTAETLSALSFNGRWLALRDATPNAATTTGVVIDTATMRVVSTLRLAGSFGLDAIASDGATLYLIQTLPSAGPQSYQVRVYDVRHARLDPRPLRENGESSSIIRGVAYTRVWSPRGDWLFTLYVQPGRSGAFVHALGVAYRRVHCIVLHDEGAAAADLAHYVLAVAPDGNALYAVNPVLGHAVAVRGGLPYGPRARANLRVRAGAPQSTQASAALSRDGRTMFVATDNGVWALDTRSLTVRATYLAGQMITSVALSRDGQRLYALSLYALLPGQNVAALDPARGRVLGGVATNANTWAIEQVIS